MQVVVAQRIISYMDDAFEVDQLKIKSSASIGIAVYPDNGSTAEEILKFADIAMYRAKKLGRNQVCFFEKEMQEQFTVRYKLETMLRKAIENDEFSLHYQPVLDPETNQLLGFEALIRWVAEGQVQYPDMFIPIAEESRLILPIGRWVIKEAIAQLAIWQKSFSSHITMAINLSVVQLTDESLITYIEKELERNSIAAEFIEFELTETALLDHSQENHNVIDQIHSLGCDIALDDFGTGYSSVSHLQNFPISTVKIDKSLMPKNEDLDKELSLIRGLVMMIQSLGMKVVGEGLETEQHLSLCRELNFDKVQGYYFDKPLKKNAVEEKYIS